MSRDADFTRAIPANIAHDQRLAIEGLALDCAMIVAEYADLCEAIAQLPLQQAELQQDFEGRLNAFRSVWSIIDRLDHVRQLLHHQREFILFAPDPSGGSALLSAQAMRNAMDHPIGSIARYGPAASNVPMFGILGWVWYGEDDLQIAEDRSFTLKGRNASLISISAIQHKFTVSALDIFDDKVYLPWGNIVLWAFGQKLYLAHANDFAQRLQQHLNTVTAAAAARALAELGVEPVIGRADIAGQLREDIHGEWTGSLNSPDL